MKNFDVNTALKGDKNAVIIIFLFFTDRCFLFSRKYLVMSSNIKVKRIFMVKNRIAKPLFNLI